MNDEEWRLDVPVMDGYHKDFLDILSSLMSASDDAFTAQFEILVHHTQEHFSTEERLMDETNFSSTREHVEDHRRVLGDLQSMLNRAKRGRITMPREYVKNGIPEWFKMHLSTMDSALAAHLKVKSNLG